MKQVEIVTSKVEMLLVDLPEESTGIVLRDSVLMVSIKYLMPMEIKIPSGNWKHLGKATELTEEDWKGIVECSDRNPLLYIDYTEKNPIESYHWMTATESGLSLLKANGVELENEYQDDWDELCTWGHGDFSKDGKTSMELYKEAESKVWKNPHIFIKQY